MKRRGWGVPLLLGIATAFLLGVSLWPDEPPLQQVVVASRDLGAGAQLTAADLTLRSLPAEQAPADALSTGEALLGKTLAVVRFAGEPITLRQIGDGVQLQPNERGIAVQVSADTGLAGLLRPGMRVGVIATLPAAEDSLYAKAMLEELRVLYVPPDFQARPSVPTVTQVSVRSGSDLTAAPVTAPPAQRLSDGVVVLAASTQPITISYQLPGELAALTGLPASTRTLVPVELLAALNAADAAFTLVLTPEQAEPYTTLGLTLNEVRVENGISQ